MSTRMNVVVDDGHDKLWFYRHSDGYPEGALPTLMKFMRHVAAGRIRDNTEEAAGWLVRIGADEYDVGPEPTNGWKVGAIEPAIEQHGDIEYLYVLNLKNCTIKVENVYSHKETTIKIVEQTTDGDAIEQCKQIED